MFALIVSPALVKMELLVKKKKSIKQVLFFKQNPVLRKRQQSRQRERETEAEINLFYILKHMVYHLRHAV